MVHRILMLLVIAASCAAPPPPLGLQDLALEGLVFEADSTDAIARFGRPDSIRTLPRSVPFGADGSTTIPVLHFRGLTLLFGEDGLLSGIDISAPPHRTIRGLRIGADSATVTRFYGPPRASDPKVWLYSSDDGLIDMAVRFEDRRVAGITVGAAEFSRAR